MKKRIAIVTAVFLIIGFTAGISQAGAARRHAIEGIILGTGVAILSTAIIHSMNKPEPVVVKHVYQHDSPRHGKKWKKKGHWKTRKIWVEPEYETRWNPGHYNRRGKWVKGRYKEFKVADGYWRSRKVWVKYNRRY